MNKIWSEDSEAITWLNSIEDSLIMSDGILSSVGLVYLIRSRGSYCYHENVNFDPQNWHALFCGIIRRPKCIWATDWCKSRWLQLTKEETVVKKGLNKLQGYTHKKRKKTAMSRWTLNEMKTGQRICPPWPHDYWTIGKQTWNSDFKFSWKTKNKQTNKQKRKSKQKLKLKFLELFKIF